MKLRQIIQNPTVNDKTNTCHEQQLTNKRKDPKILNKMMRQDA